MFTILPQAEEYIAGLGAKLYIIAGLVLLYRTVTSVSYGIFIR